MANNMSGVSAGVVPHVHNTVGRRRGHRGLRKAGDVRERVVNNAGGAYRRFSKATIRKLEKWESKHYDFNPPREMRVVPLGVRICSNLSSESVSSESSTKSPTDSVGGSSLSSGSASSEPSTASPTDEGKRPSSGTSTASASPSEASNRSPSELSTVSTTAVNVEALKAVVEKAEVAQDQEKPKAVEENKPVKAKRLTRAEKEKAEGDERARIVKKLKEEAELRRKKSEKAVQSKEEDIDFIVRSYIKTGKVGSAEMVFKNIWIYSGNGRDKEVDPLYQVACSKLKEFQK